MAARKRKWQSAQATEERKEKVANMLQNLEVELTKLANDKEAWKKWLDAQVRFHQYSANNVLLIMWQRPDATVVAGYRRWQELGRQVRKGERSIKILMPRIVKDRESADPDARKLVGFMGGSVFDISQTDGPAIGTERDLKTNDGEQVLADLANVAEEMGLTVKYADLGMAAGRTNGKWIEIREGMAIDMQASVMAHEIAHCQMKHIGSDTPTAIRELEAESASYVVCGILGLNTGAVTAPYIASWTQGTELDAKEMKELVKASTKRIVDCAKYVLERMNANAAEDAEAA